MLETLLCMAMAVYFEARGEEQEGYIAVAQVIMERSEQQHKDPCDIVKQGPINPATGFPYHDECQFSFWCDGKPEEILDQQAYSQAWSISMLVYFDLLPNITGNATHFHADYVTPYWTRAAEQTVSIGNQHYYKFP